MARDGERKSGIRVVAIAAATLVLAGMVVLGIAAWDGRGAAATSLPLAITGLAAVALGELLAMAALVPRLRARRDPRSLLDVYVVSLLAAAAAVAAAIWVGPWSVPDIDPRGPRDELALLAAAGVAASVTSAVALLATWSGLHQRARAAALLVTAVVAVAGAAWGANAVVAPGHSTNDEGMSSPGAGPHVESAAEVRADVRNELLIAGRSDEQFVLTRPQPHGPLAGEVSVAARNDCSVVLYWDLFAESNPVEWKIDILPGTCGEFHSGLVEAQPIETVALESFTGRAPLQRRIDELGPRSDWIAVAGPSGPRAPARCTDLLDSALMVAVHVGGPRYAAECADEQQSMCAELLEHIVRRLDADALLIEDLSIAREYRTCLVDRGLEDVAIERSVPGLILVVPHREGVEQARRWASCHNEVNRKHARTRNYEDGSIAARGPIVSGAPLASLLIPAEESDGPPGPGIPLQGSVDVLDKD